MPEYIVKCTNDINNCNDKCTKKKQTKAKKRNKIMSDTREDIVRDVSSRKRHLTTSGC